MQPVYLSGHSRPVRKIMFNLDGDLLFTCSDDTTVCMYNTTKLLERVGIFQIKDSCKSIDVSKDSKLLFATATTSGVKIFDTSNGDQLADIPIDSLLIKLVELSYSDKQFIVVSENNKRESVIKVFNTKDALDWGIRKPAEGERKTYPACTTEIKAPRDHGINCVKWGGLDKVVYYGTDKGRLVKYDFDEKKVVKAQDVHKNEIFSIEMSHDFTMMFTCSKDGYCKLLHPETFQEIRSFMFEFPCRDVTINPMFDSSDQQKFHIILCGGQDAKDVTTTGAQKGGFEMKMYNIIHNELLATIKGHFGTVHTVAFHPDGSAFVSGSEDGYVHYHRMLPEYFTKKFE